MTFDYDKWVKEIKDKYGQDFEQAYNYLDEGNSRHDLILWVLRSIAKSKEDLEKYLNEVHSWSKD